MPVNPLNWLRHHCFNAVHSHSLIYNTCWEDPRLDRQAMQLGPKDVVLVITSAGCNALDYALEAPQAVHAVDVNPRQNALLELKMAGIRGLEFEDFFEIFGRGTHQRFPDVYRSALRPHLTPAARAFWDRNQRWFEGSRYHPSLYYHGTSGVVAWLMNQYIDRVARARDVIESILHAPTIQEQRRIYQEELREAIFGKTVRWFVRRDSTMAMLGVPRPQREQIDRDYAGGLAQFIEDSISTVFSALPLHDNYFWRVYLTGQYTRACSPEYLKPDNFQRLKSGLVDRISVHTQSVAGFLDQTPVSVTRFVLLDHMDWLSRQFNQALLQEWQQILRRAAPSARLLWRSAGLRTDFIDRLNVTVNGARRPLGEILRYQRDLAADLHTRDRVHTYGSFHIADLAMA